MNQDEADLDERRRAEVEFVSAAYEPDEAWCERNNNSSPPSSQKGASNNDVHSCAPWIVNRRLQLPTAQKDNEKDEDSIISVVISLFMPARYPAHSAIEISGHVEDDRCTTTNHNILKASHDALPSLLEACRETASSLIGDEAVFGVLSRADEWIQDDWPRLVAQTSTTSTQSTLDKAATAQSSTPTVMTRILIYSHHIISKKKRSDMKQLASQYNLTGYVKIGWPGLIICEGFDTACHDFYDEIRRWNWKYLVVRGEMQEPVTIDSTEDDRDSSASASSMRRFQKFVEVDDMSVVATACREADLEDLFRTSMKVYSKEDGGMTEAGASLTTSAADHDKPYGVLAHVDHMNDGKGYIKWLCKNASDLDICLAIKSLHSERSEATSNSITNGRQTNIIVCLVSEKASVSSLLKRWRTSRVDVDVRGKPCLERMMAVLMEGDLERAPSSRINWEQHQQPFNGPTVPSSSDAISGNDSNDVLDLVRAIGGQGWVDALQGATMSR